MGVDVGRADLGDVCCDSDVSVECVLKLYLGMAVADGMLAVGATPAEPGNTAVRQGLYIGIPM